MDTTTFLEKNKPGMYPLYFTRLQVAMLMLLCTILGILISLAVWVDQQGHGRVPDFISIQGSVYYDSEHKGVTVTYWSKGKIIGTADHVISAICRNLQETDSITIKTPWP